MSRTLALAIAIATLSGSAALAQTIRAPLSDQPTATWLVKHDKDDNGDNGHGRKLGHFKHRGGDDGDDDEDGGRRSSSRSRANSPWNNYAPSPYYGAPPGYGTSYPPPYYDYPPPYYRGY
jgi:hypothetical protein